MHVLKETENGNFGYVAEELFYNDVAELGLFVDIKREEDLIKAYGHGLASIDYLLFLHDAVIPVQIKYRRSRRRENLAINNFLNSIRLLNGFIDKPILFGLWVSRLSPFDDNKHKREEYNVKCVDEYQDLKRLITKSVDCIKSNVYDVIGLPIST